MEPTHDPAIAELLSFFDFAHLRERTPHLAAASEPFHRLAHIMAPDPSAAVDGLRATILRMDCEPGREAAAAALKLRRLEAALVAPDYAVIDSAGPEDFLRTLLEAKDCAVRAALVRHRAEQADGLTSSKTVAVADLPGLLAGVERLAVQHNRTIDAAKAKAEAAGFREIAGVWHPPDVHALETPDDRERAIVRRLAGEWGEIEVGPTDTIDDVVSHIHGAGSMIMRLVNEVGDWSYWARKHLGSKEHRDPKLRAALDERLTPAGPSKPSPFIVPGSLRVDVPEDVNPRTLGGVTWSATVRGTVDERMDAAGNLTMAAEPGVTMPDDEIEQAHVDALRGLHNAPPPVIVSRKVRTFTDEDGCPHVESDDEGPNP